MKIEELFRLTRELQGKKQTDIARQVGITRPALSNLESSRSSLSIATLQKIAPLININPEFVIDQAKNPFQSKELIKMFFDEKLAYYILEPLNVLITFNDELKFISLISNFDLPPKISRLSLSPHPIYAIAVKDKDNNIFLLRRKLNTAFVKVDGSLYMDVWSIIE
ncbi:MAG: helix-turn-helix transcriptional regulator, partial [Deltaproteobacteria bacterium]|nr:helix-turn-helix transcriptional regulator [Deltaproteobacteria bacterium]